MEGLWTTVRGRLLKKRRRRRRRSQGPLKKSTPARLPLPGGTLNQM